MKHAFWTGTLLVAAMAPCCLAGPFDWTFALVPPAVDATAGSTMGWGYSITNNDPSNYLVLGGFSPDPIAYTSSTNPLFDYPILAPGATSTESWIQGVQGLYEITWNPSAPAGYAAVGNLTVSADWWSGDPSVTDPSTLTDFGTVSLSAPFTATVDVAELGSVPEPATALLFAAGLLVVLASRSRAQSPT